MTRPTAYTGPYPIRTHRTMEEVIRHEKVQERSEHPGWVRAFLRSAGEL